MTIAQCRPHARISEPDNIRQPISRQCRHKPRMLIHLPTLLHAEVRQHIVGSGKPAPSRAQRGPYPCIAKSDDVRKSTVRQLGNKPRVQLRPPTLVVTQVRKNELRRAKAAAIASPSRVCAFSRTSSSSSCACQAARSTTSGRGNASTSMRQSAPFLNASGWRDPARRAASSPMPGS